MYLWILDDHFWIDLPHLVCKWVWFRRKICTWRYLGDGKSCNIACIRRAFLTFWEVLDCLQVTCDRYLIGAVHFAEQLNPSSVLLPFLTLCRSGEPENVGWIVWPRLIHCPNEVNSRIHSIHEMQFQHRLRFLSKEEEFNQALIRSSRTILTRTADMQWGMSYHVD